MIGHDEQNRADLFDFLVDGMKEVVERQNDDGSVTSSAEFNPEIAYFKGHMINQPFGSFVKRQIQFENMAEECFNFMSYDRAVDFAKSIKRLAKPYRRSIDAKSSETYKDAHNTQDSLVHVVSKNKVVRQYDVTGQNKQSFVDGFLHRDKEKDSERD